MAKYRYLPRILRAWIAVDQLAPAALEVGDWEGMVEVVTRADDAITALPLYTNAVEGSRSGKRKKKTDAQKQMLSDLTIYKTEIGNLEKAVKKKDLPKAKASLAKARESLLSYRQIARIDAEDGGCVQIPLGNAEEVRQNPQHCADKAKRPSLAKPDHCAPLLPPRSLQAGHAGAPLGYVVPAFRGGGVSMDFALRDGEPMMKNGIITDEYRKKFQK